MKRILKVSSVGENRRMNLKAQIKLEGKWLLVAGILPESHVVVTNPKPGVLILQVQD